MNFESVLSLSLFLFSNSQSEERKRRAGKDCRHAIVCTARTAGHTAHCRILQAHGRMLPLPASLFVSTTSTNANGNGNGQGTQEERDKLRHRTRPVAAADICPLCLPACYPPHTPQTQS